MTANGQKDAIPRFPPCWLVLVGFSKPEAVAALKFCNQTFFWIPRSRRVLAANSPGLLRDCRISSLVQGWNVIQGSNAQHEFSGWQQGLDFLRQGQDTPSSVVFVNDTISTHRHFSTFRKLAFLASISGRSSGRAVGFTDRLPDNSQFSVLEYRSERWISTYLFFLDAQCLARMGHELWSPERNDACVRGGVDEATFFSGCVSENLRDHLRNWLFHGGWYRSAPLTADNARAHELKAKSIINEMLLSATLTGLNLRVADPFDAFPWMGACDASVRGFRKRMSGLRSSAHHARRFST